MIKNDLYTIMEMYHDCWWKKHQKKPKNRSKSTGFPTYQPVWSHILLPPSPRKIVFWGSLVQNHEGLCGRKIPHRHVLFFHIFMHFFWYQAGFFGHLRVTLTWKNWILLHCLKISLSAHTWWTVCVCLCTHNYQKTIVQRPRNFRGIPTSQS